MIRNYSSDIQKIIIRELSSSIRSIKLAVAWFTNQTLLRELICALGRGVSVEVLLNYDDINKTMNFEEFLNKGGSLKWNKSQELLHDKFCIIDESTVIEGSYNWTNKAEHNCETITIIKEELESIQFYLDKFTGLSSIYIPARSCSFVDNLRYFDSYRVFRTKNPYNGKLRFLVQQEDVYSLLDENTFARVSKSEFLSFKDFEEGAEHLIIKGRSGWGIMDTDNGKVILDCVYELIEPDSAHYYFIKRNGKYGYFGIKEGQLVPCSLSTKAEALKMGMEMIRAKYLVEEIKQTVGPFVEKFAGFKPSVKNAIEEMLERKEEQRKLLDKYKNR